MRRRSILLATVLTSIAAIGRLGAQTVDAKANYDENCRKCHGVRGAPPKTMKDKFPKIATFDAKFLEAHSVDSIVKVLTKGKNDDMKSCKDKMSPAELKAVAEYVHELQKAKP